MDLVDEGDPVQQVLLERHRDQLFDLGRGKSESFGPDLNHRRTELGELVDRDVAHLRHADGDQTYGECDDKTPEFQARRNDPPHHRKNPSPSLQPGNATGSSPAATLFL